MTHRETNVMGSSVKQGYRCKPEQSAPNKPIMHYKMHVFVCDGGRCGEVHKDDYADYLRGIVKDMGLDKTKDRIKVSRSQCFGACRFKGVAVIYANGVATDTYKNAIWISRINTFSKDDWERIFLGLKDNARIEDIIPRDHRIEMKLYE